MTRRLLLDFQVCQDSRNGDRGLGRAARELVGALVRRPDVVARLLLNPQLAVPRHLPPALIDSPLLAWNTAAAVDAARAEGPVAYHLMSPFEMSTPGPIAVPAHCIGDESTPLVVTLHDLIPLHEPARLLRGNSRRQYLQRIELVRQADLILCVSAHTRDEAVSLLGVDPQRCAVIGGGASERFRPAAPGDAAPAQLLRRCLPVLNRPYVLMLSGGDERKNTEGLIEAFARIDPEVRRRHQLVVACELAPGIEETWRRSAAQAGVTADELVLTGFVADELLVALYQRASLVVVPSFREGFGLPVVEAIACDRPVVTSSTTSLPEILDMPESTFEPADIASMSRVVGRGLVDQSYRRDLRYAGRRARPRHTWDAVADRALDALECLDSRWPARRGRGGARRLRLALVGPLPPVTSGVADYNARVCALLGRRVDLDVIVPEEARGLSRCRDGPYRVFGGGALGTSLDPFGYDAIVYTIGNSEFHVSTWELAQRIPGIVWLHDVRLGGLHLVLAHERHPDDPAGWMRSVLATQYGPMLPDLARQADPFDRTWQDRRGIFLTRELVSGARAVLVNSRFAADLVGLDQGPDGVTPPVTVLPFGAHTPPEDVEPCVRDSDPPVVASFGLMDWIKAPDALLESLARIRGQAPARLVFVGGYWQPHLDELRGTASRLGVDDLVEATGAVDDDEWWRWMRRARVAVQLRRITNGESSAAIADAQAVGTPVVTNMANARLDQPPGAVWPVDPRLVGAELDDALVALLTEPATWRTYSEAGRAHAAASGFERVVDELLVSVEALVAGATR